jgi:hypothetical protein
VFFLFWHLHRKEASFQNDLSAVVPVVMLGFGSMASHPFLEIHPCRRLSHPMLCCCVMLGCDNGVWASFVSPPSSLMARVTMAAHFGRVVLHFLVSLVVVVCEDVRCVFWAAA